MSEIVVPIANVWMKSIAVPILAFIGIGAIWWGSRKLVWCLQVIRGISPPPPNRTRKGAVGGAGLNPAIIFIGLAASYFALGILTTQPYVIEEKGITVGARPPRYQSELISWEQISRVDCFLDRNSRKISSLRVQSPFGRYTLANGATPLEPALQSIQAHLPGQIVSSCILE
jgi:hypothetical protein